VKLQDRIDRYAKLDLASGRSSLLSPVSESQSSQADDDSNTSSNSDDEYDCYAQLDDVDDVFVELGIMNKKTKTFSLRQWLMNLQSCLKSFAAKVEQERFTVDQVGAL
jgi:hypothetical protein